MTMQRSVQSRRRLFPFPACPKPTSKSVVSPHRSGGSQRSSLTRVASAVVHARPVVHPSLSDRRHVIGLRVVGSSSGCKKVQGVSKCSGRSAHTTDLRV